LNRANPTSGHFDVNRYQINALRPTAIIVHGLHKTGTMFLYQLFHRLSRARRIAYYSANHEQPNDHQVDPNLDHDFCLCPIRSYADEPGFLGEQFQTRRIFHVRDPRDIVVSQYFSYGWRHTDDGFHKGHHRQRETIQSLCIDEYVLQRQSVIDPLKAQFADLIHRQPYELRNVIRYEQMVLNFPQWLESVITHFEFRMPAAVKARFAFRYRHEFQPEDDPKSHKRNVTPGDHLRKLQPATIDQLNQIFEPELRALKYAFDGSLREVA